MPFPTGNDVASTFYKLTVLVPSSSATLTDDWFLNAIVGALLELTEPLSWNDVGFSITMEQAADLMVTVTDSITLEPF